MIQQSPRFQQPPVMNPADFRAEGRLPLIVGVTGHRAFAESAQEAILQRATEFFQTLSDRIPNTPIIVLSSLAAGADLMIARIARDHKCSVIAALPLPEDDYFTPENYAADQLAEARAALGSASQTVIVSDLLDLTKSEAVSNEEYATHAYRMAGAYVAHHCHILLALWDDGETVKDSITAATVRYKLQGAPEIIAGPLSPLASVETGYVYHVYAPRPNSPAGSKAPGQATRLFAADVLDTASATAVYDRIIRNLEWFNQDVTEALLAPAFRERTQRSERDLIGAAVHFLTPDIHAMARVYAVTDVLSQRYQRAAKGRFVTIILLLLLAPLSIVVYGDWSFAEKSSWLLLVAAVSIACVFAVVGMTRRRGTPQDRYQDYRALAEGLRVQFYWRVADLPFGVARHYLREEKSELDWIRQGLRTMDSPLYREAGSRPIAPGERLERYRLVRTQWIGTQMAWFFKRGTREAQRARSLERAIMGLGVLYTALTLVAGLWLTVTRSDTATLFQTSLSHHDIVVFCFDLIALTTGICQLWVERMGWAAHAREYRKMGQLFERADTRLGTFIEAQRTEEAAELIGGIGFEALAENGDWLLLHRERPLESTILG